MPLIYLFINPPIAFTPSVIAIGSQLYRVKGDAVQKVNKSHKNTKTLNFHKSYLFDIPNFVAFGVLEI
jgi:hypothetical protein